MMTTREAPVPSAAPAVRPGRAVLSRAVLRPSEDRGIRHANRTIVVASTRGRTQP